MNISSAWNREAPPGFRGLRDDLPLTVYYRHLPHWRQDDATYFVTFHLADSLPQSKRRELQAIKREWAAEHGIRRTQWHSALGSGKRISRTECHSVLQQRPTREDWESLARKVMQKVERWLDQGMGDCWLERPEASRIVVDSLHHYDNERYELDCYAVMPNHLHAILRPLQPASDPLEKILQSRKRHMSREINAILGRSGSLWHEESFDRIVRDEEHLYRCIQYIGRNPANAGLPPERWIQWIRPSWENLGWRFDDPSVSVGRNGIPS